MAVQLLKHKFTVEEYHKMGEAGVFSEDDRVELLEGEIVKMTPIGSRHAACVARLTALFSKLQDKAIVWVQNPIRLDEQSEPQPDLALLRPRADFYAQIHPGPKDVLLLIEVAETSVDYDRVVKIPLYAEAEIGEVWLVNLQTGLVEVCRRPSARGYGEVRQARRGQRIALEAFPELELAVEDIVG